MKWVRRLNTKELNKLDQPEAQAERKRRAKRKVKRLTKIAFTTKARVPSLP